MRARWRSLTVLVALALIPIRSAGAQEQSAFPGIGGLPTSVPNPSQNGPWMEAWSGFGFTNSFYGGYFGALRALNPKQDLWSEGFVLRFEGQAGHYDYLQGSNPSLPNPQVDFHGGGMLVGYRHLIGTGNDTSQLTGYLGVVYQHHANPDPGASLNGTQAGVKALVEYYTPLLSNSAYFYGQAFAMTPFSSWLVYAQLPFKLADKIWFGPEVLLFGNEAPFKEGRVGGVVRFENAFNVPGVNFSISAGYRKPIDSASPDGYYVNIHLSKEFH